MRCTVVVAALFLVACGSGGGDSPPEKSDTLSKSILGDALPGVTPKTEPSVQPVTDPAPATTPADAPVAEAPAATPATPPPAAAPSTPAVEPAPPAAPPPAAPAAVASCTFDEARGECVGDVPETRCFTRTYPPKGDTVPPPDCFVRTGTAPCQSFIDENQGVCVQEWIGQHFSCEDIASGYISENDRFDASAACSS